jgi:cytochrome d ubiquinol oxidase subunit I
MVGLGTIFIAIMVVSVLLLWMGKLYDAKWMLWILMLSLPFPYIANTAGWMTAELGRQPWLVYGLMRTAEGYSKSVVCRKWNVYASGLSGHVHGAGNSVFVLGAPRN